MNEASAAWLQERFYEFYEANPPPLPDRFGRREFGFLFFGKGYMVRHVGFPTAEEFQSALLSNPPAHAYYSTAFYRNPAAPTMDQKGWLGAELIFDLDADHVPGAEKLPYAQQLERVKGEFQKLVDEYILGDFGFSESDIVLTFSGGRGYHCHVMSPKVLPLTTKARREITDYVTGKAVEELALPREVAFEGRMVLGHEQVKKTYAVVPPTAPGWKGRVTRSLVTRVEQVLALPEEKRVDELSAYDGIGPTKAKKFLAELTPDRMQRLRAGYYDQSDAIRALVKAAIGQAAVTLGKGETDEPVTSDIKRLIRLPGSLHGKTGLKVINLTRRELDSFDPLRAAVPFGDATERVVGAKDASFTLKGDAFQVAKGQRTELPRFAAVFAVTRGLAEVAVAPSAGR